MDRDFKGVWIPKEIWLSKELSLLEKAILTEINSLDNENHCTAGNEYFAEFCNCSASAVSKAIKHLKELNLIEEIEFDGRHRKLRIVNFTNQNSKIYYAESYNLLTNNIDNNTNNKNNNISSKEDILTQNFELGKPKKKKSNLYTKCATMIYGFTDIPALQKLLFTYLDMRLEIRDKPLYANQFKGMLNKLASYSDSATLLCEIVQQSIDRAYLSFFPVNNYKQGKSTHDAIHESGSGVVVNDTKEDAEKREQFRAKMEAEGKKAVF